MWKHGAKVGIAVRTKRYRDLPGFFGSVKPEVANQETRGSLAITAQRSVVIRTFKSEKRIERFDYVWFRGYGL